MGEAFKWRRVPAASAAANFPLLRRRSSATPRLLPLGFWAAGAAKPEWSRLLLLCSGDIELNPGPVYPCVRCDTPVGRDSVACVDCWRWCHRACAGLTAADMRAQIRSHTWACGCVGTTAPTGPPRPATAASAATATATAASSASAASASTSSPCSAASNRAPGLRTRTGGPALHSAGAAAAPDLHTPGRRARAYAYANTHAHATALAHAHAHNLAAATRAQGHTHAAPRTRTHRQQTAATAPPKRLTVLQWNIDGWRARHLSLAKLIEESDADVVMLQETKLCAGDEAQLRLPRGWSAVLKARQQHRQRRDVPQGGLACLVREGLKFEELQTAASTLVPPGSCVEAMVVRVFTSPTQFLDIYNLYRPPVRGGATDQRSAPLHCHRWPTTRTSLICADVNAHGSWDRQVAPDALGAELDDWLDASGWIVLNTAPTRLAANGLCSSPDVTLMHGCWGGRADWTALQPCGSDHLPLRTSLQLCPMQSARRPPTFSLRKADWASFTLAADEQLRASPEPLNIEQEARTFAAAVLGAAVAHIPRGARRSPKAWWTEECDAARVHYRHCCSTLRASPSPAAAEECAAAKTEMARIIGDAKRASWRAFATSLDPRTPATRVWATLRAMDGRGRAALPDQPISAGDRKLVSDSDKAKRAAAHYASVSRLQIPRAKAKAAYLAVRRQLDSRQADDDACDAAFTDGELGAALAAMRETAPGQDEIHPGMLKRLSTYGKERLLALINNSWATGYVPTAWRRAIIVPILKRGKPAHDIKSYRPVSLLSCIAKCAEIMIKNRLQHWAQEHHLLSDNQAGFTAGRSTTDCIAQLLQPAFDQLNAPKPAPRSLMVAVDFAAAFDRVWRGGLLRDLANAGASGRLLRWLRTWLSDRRASVRWNGSISSPRVIQQGVPQGSPLSPLVFLLASSSLPAAVARASPSVLTVAYADDLTLVVHNKNVNNAAAAMQQALDAVDDWAAEHEVRLAPEKTEALLVTVDPQQLGGRCAPPLRLAGQPVRYEQQLTVLGVRIDNQLRMGAHAQLAAARAQRRLNILRALAGTTWGGDRASLRLLYNAYIRPSALYASGVWWGFTAATHRAALERRNTAAARIITGLPAGSPSVATRREADLLPCSVHASAEAATLLLHGRRFPSNHPLGQLSKAPVVVARLRARGDTDRRGSWRTLAEEALTAAVLPEVDIDPWPPPADLPPPWSPVWSQVRFYRTQLTGGDDDDGDAASRRADADRLLADLRATDPPDIEVWSDGSARDGFFDGGGGAVTITYNNDDDSWRLPETTSVPAGLLTSSTTAEAAGAAAGMESVCERMVALSFLCEQRDFARPCACAHRRLTISLLFDSLALWYRLQRLTACARLDAATLRVLQSLQRLAAHGHGLNVIWVPSHCGLEGNEAADEAAAIGSRQTQDVPVAAAAARAFVNRHRRAAAWNIFTAETDRGATHWRATEGALLPDYAGACRQSDVLLFQLRLNRAPLAHTLHRWDRVPSPSCPFCGAAEETTDHFLLACQHWQEQRIATLGQRPTLRCLQDEPAAVVAFVRATGRLD